jgi:hypothetical protein
MAIYKADRPLLQPDVDENQTSLDPVELTAELVQGIGHGDRRKAYRGPGAEAVIFPSQSQATVADDQLIVARSSQSLTAVRAARRQSRTRVTAKVASRPTAGAGERPQSGSSIP